MRTLFTSVVLVASVGLVVGGTEITASAAKANTITSVSPSKPIANEAFTVRGKLSTAVERPIQLQRKTKSGWKKVKSAATKPDGRFSITSATSGKRTIRVFAQRVTIGDKSYAPRITAARTIKVASQTVKVTTSRKTAKSGQTISLTIANTPVRKGRAIALRGSFKPAGAGETQEFSPLTVGYQNSKGKLRISDKLEEGAPLGVFTYQAVAVEQNGAARKYSNKIVIRIIK